MIVPGKGLLWVVLGTEGTGSEAAGRVCGVAAVAVVAAKVVVEAAVVVVIVVLAGAVADVACTDCPGCVGWPVITAVVGLLLSLLAVVVFELQPATKMNINTMKTVIKVKIVLLFMPVLSPNYI
jgi:hypothetical protein